MQRVDTREYRICDLVHVHLLSKLFIFSKRCLFYILFFKENMDTIPTNDQHGHASAPPAYQESNVHHNPSYQPDTGHSYGFSHPDAHGFDAGHASGHGGY
uniref:Uncharacterized protein n=1 Tax=Bursaphelenchus xylophilus TaxID=6326 RepID=A0A1I7S9M3_BURXY